MNKEHFSTYACTTLSNHALPPPKKLIANNQTKKCGWVVGRRVEEISNINQADWAPSLASSVAVGIFFFLDRKLFV